MPAIDDGSHEWYAFLVGTGVYQAEAIKNVPQVTKDVDALCEVLQQRGYQRKNILKLTDAPVNRIKNSLAHFIRDVLQKNPNSTVLVYFSGHGYYPEKGQDKTYYFLCTDTGYENGKLRLDQCLTVDIY
ncbi:MAG: caspase family protein [Candidatus Hermodarchaeota archaeon]